MADPVKRPHSVLNADGVYDKHYCWDGNIDGSIARPGSYDLRSTGHIHLRYPPVIAIKFYITSATRGLRWGVSLRVHRSALIAPG